jgi:hypothetical protein
MTTSFLTNRAGVAALIAGAWAVLITGAAQQYPYPHVFHHDVDSPVIALEISRDAQDIDAVLHRTDAEKRRAAAAASLTNVNWLDLIFIPLYGFSIWALARVFATRTRLLTLGILAAMLFDYIEDWEIYRAIAGENPPVYIPSLVKWGLLALVFLLLSRILLRSASPVYTLSTKRLMAIGYFISGALIILDVALGDWIGYSHIPLAMSVFSLLVVVNVVGFLGHYLALPAIKQTFVEHFCDRRKEAKDGSMTAVTGERAN